MSDGTKVEIVVAPVQWGITVGGTPLMNFRTKAEAVKYARQFARDMRESEGTRGKVRIRR